MAFNAKFDHWAGILPLLESARTIVERDFAEALTWRYSPATPPASYARIQFTQRHSAQFPLLVLQPATSTPEALTGGVLQRHTFDCEIYLTSAAAASDDIDDLARDLVRYLDATTMVFLSAPASDWRANLPNDDGGKVRVWCTNVVFGQLQQAVERNGLYLHSVAFELQIDLLEAE